MSIYDTLNPEQQKAVLHDEGPLLILAGAGSGKTRVLTHRIAYLIDERGVNPWNILAITFTNKAAREMRERVDNLVGYGSENIWVSTFHSTCVRILRRFIESLGYDRNFTIYDAEDQKTLIREVCKYLNIDTKDTKERSFLSAISSAKDELIGPEEYMARAAGDYGRERCARIYQEYQKRLKANNALDFDDLIFKTVELFRANPETLLYYQKRFRYIMVDEYQDTNTAQFRLISLLADARDEDGRPVHNLCVVGDDDQSIYRFRGANIYNILNFEKEYPDTEVIRLEQNYRSTQSILDAANEVIRNNLGRKEKSLWTKNAKGAPVRLIQYETDYEEALGIVNEIEEEVREGKASYHDFALLYRTNAQSRVLEEKMIVKGIPYKVIGSINFYQRREIKDLLSYLKTIDNGLDNLSVKRIINVPRRGIGLTTLDRIDSYADRHGISFYQALLRARDIPGIGRSVQKVESFAALIESLKSRLSSPGYSLKDLVDEILTSTGYLEDLKAEEGEAAADRIGNINELINKISDYEDSCEEEPTLSGFLEEVALVADIDNLEEDSDYVVLMTLHSAKGLEFPYVYLCGMEEGIFPSYLSISAQDPETEIEEERRLCYVGITRAMKRLTLTAARQRMLRGEPQFNRLSRFVGEIPRYLLTIESPGRSPYLNRSLSASSLRFPDSPPRASRPQPEPSSKTLRGGIVPDSRRPLPNFDRQAPAAQTSPRPAGRASGSMPQSPVRQFGSGPIAAPEYQVGDKVRHMRFGTGVVTALTRGGRDYEVTVEFEKSGTKKMLTSFAKMEKINSSP